MRAAKPRRGARGGIPPRALLAFWGAAMGGMAGGGSSCGSFRRGYGAAINEEVGWRVSSRSLLRLFGLLCPWSAGALLFRRALLRGLSRNYYLDFRFFTSEPMVIGCEALAKRCLASSFFHLLRNHLCWGVLSLL